MYFVRNNKTFNDEYVTKHKIRGFKWINCYVRAVIFEHE